MKRIHGASSLIWTPLLLAAAFVQACAPQPRWFPIGPAPIDNYLDGVTGRASALALNPHNPDELWVGTAAGGVWHSTDGGINWEPESDKQRYLPIGALAVDGCTASGCTTIYAGTGENAIRRDTYHGGGLLVGEITGTQLPRVRWKLRTGAPADFAGGSIQDILVLPAGPSGKRLMVALSSGITVSASEATITAPVPASGYGLFQSDDDGLSWTQLTVAGLSGEKPTDLERDAADPTILFAGFLGRGIFKSTDGGATWCPLNEADPTCPAVTGLPHPSTGFDWVEIEVAPSDSSVLYATFGQCPDRLIDFCVPRFFRSVDSGLTWTEHIPARPHPNPPDDQPDLMVDLIAYTRYTHALAVKPDDPDWVLLGGLSLYRTEDGGANWLISNLHALAPTPGSRSIHPDHRGVVFHPTDANRAYGVNDGGVNVSFDGGSTWEGRNLDLQITGFHGLDASPLTAAVLGGSQDNGALLWTGPSMWGWENCCGDAGFTVLDHDDVMKMYAMNNFGEPKRSMSGGGTWATASTGISTADPRLFYAPLVQGPIPDSGNRPLFMGASRLYVSTDDALSWDPMSPELATGPQPEIVTAPDWASQTPDSGVNVITTIAPSPADEDRVWIGYYGGEVFRTKNNLCAAPGCWDQKDNGLPGSTVTFLAAHPTDKTIAWAALSGFAAGPKLYKTVDDGDTWLPSATGLPEGVPINVVVVESSDPDTLYVGLDSAPNGVSLYRSVDGGDHWSSWSLGLPNAPVFQIVIDETRNRMFAATHGRGAWVIGDAFISNFEGWVHDSIWDLPVYGQNFPANATCEMKILQSNGDVCASGTVDVMGGTIETDGDGVLQTSLASMWSGRPVAWACYNGTCVGGTPIADCFDDADGDGTTDPLSTIQVICDGVMAANRTVGCPPLDNPPSTVAEIDLGGLPPPMGTSSAAAVMSRRESQPGPSAGRVVMTASVQRRVGTESLCSVAAPFEPGESSLAVLERLAAAVKESATCAERSVTPVIDRGPDRYEAEDVFPRAPRILIRAPDVHGGQLVTALHVRPDDARETCLALDGLGIPVLNQIHVVKIDLLTPPEGVAGGELTFVETTPIGRCQITLPLEKGANAEAVGKALEDAIRIPGIPGPHRACPARVNPRDLVAKGASLIVVAASRLELCTDDPGLGFDLRSEELENAHPIADAGDDRKVERGDVVLDGSASLDPDDRPGIATDLVAWRWYDVSGEEPDFLGDGERLQVKLLPGRHSIRLEVRDRGELSDSDEIVVDVGGG